MLLSCWRAVAVRRTVRPRAAEETAERVQLAATYRVEFGAFNLGDFHLTATLADPKYELKAKGQFSVISGMIYRASGKTESTGNFEERRRAFPVQGHLQGWQQERGAPLHFRQWRRGSNFHRATKKPSPRSVPVTADQLENVLDPLTAAFLSVRAKGSPSHLDICQRTVPVFDGKQRFDIVLTPKRSERAEECAAWRFWSVGGLPREVRAHWRLSA